MPERRQLSEQEYNAVVQEVLRSAPPNLDEATFNRWIEPTMRAAIQEAELRQPAPRGTASGRFFSNAASMLNPVEMVRGAYQAVRHPVDTATAIVGQMGDQWSQAGDAAREGRYSEMVGHAAAGSIPVIGPAAAEIGEQIGGGDVAGGLGATTGLLAPAVAAPTVRAARNASPGTLRASIAERLQAGASERYADVMSPKVGANKTRFGNAAERVAPDLAARPELAAWSRTGLESNVAQAFEAAVSKLDEASNARLEARTFSTRPIIEALKKQRERWVAHAVDASQNPRTTGTRTSAVLGPDSKPVQVGTATTRPFGRDVVPPENAARVARIDQAIKDLEQLGPSARYEAIRRIREAADQSARVKYNPSMTQDFLKHQGSASGAADVTAVLREQLAKFDPQTAAANTEYSLFKTASDVLEAAAETERTRPKVGRQIVARLTGATVGAEAGGLKGAIAGYVIGPIVDSFASSGTTTKLQTAKLMTQLAEAIQKNQTTRVYSLVEQLRRTARTTTGMAARATAGGHLPGGEPATAPSR